MMGIFLRGEDEEAYSRAALDVVGDHLHIGSVWPGDSSTTIEGMQNRIDRAREWVATVDDKRAQRAYNGWLDFFEGRVRKARDELTTHAERNRREQSDREYRKRQERVATIAPSMPKPPHCR